MIVFMLVVLTMVFLVAVVAWLVPLAFRIIFNRTLKTFVIALLSSISVVYD